MWLWRQISKIKWSDKVNDEDVLQLVEEDKATTTKTNIACKMIA